MDPIKIKSYKFDSNGIRIEFTSTDFENVMMISRRNVEKRYTLRLKIGIEGVYYYLEMPENVNVDIGRYDLYVSRKDGTEERIIFEGISNIKNSNDYNTYYQIGNHFSLFYITGDGKFSFLVGSLLDILLETKNVVINGKMDITELALDREMLRVPFGNYQNCEDIRIYYQNGSNFSELNKGLCSLNNGNLYLRISDIEFDSLVLFYSENGTNYSSLISFCGISFNSTLLATMVSLRSRYNLNKIIDTYEVEYVTNDKINILEEKLSKDAADDSLLFLNEKNLVKKKDLFLRIENQEGYKILEIDKIEGNILYIRKLYSRIEKAIDATKSDGLVLLEKEGVYFFPRDSFDASLISGEKKCRNIIFPVADVQIEDSKILLESMSTMDSNSFLFIAKSREIEPEYKRLTFEKLGTDYLIDYQQLISMESKRWDLYNLTVREDSLVWGRIRKIAAVREKSDRYLNIERLAIDAFVTLPYLTLKNEVSIVTNKGQNLSSEIFGNITNVSKIKSDKQSLLLELDNKSDFLPKEIVLNLRNGVINRSISIPVNIKNDKIVAKIYANLLDLEPYYWDIFLVGTLNGLHCSFRIKLKNGEILNQINRQISSLEVNLENKSKVFYPYVTKDNHLAFCFREKLFFENIPYRIKEKIAFLIYKMFKPYFTKKKIWLTYEKESMYAQDNSFSFFSYIRENYPNRPFFYVIDENSNDFEKVAKIGNVVKRMSMKHLIYLYAAQLFISSESKGHAYDVRIQKGRIPKYLNSKKFVFLQHGVIGLKKIDNIFQKSKNKNLKLFVTSSEMEKDIIVNDFGYPSREVIVTGLSRWDYLIDNRKEKVVLIMPTWRGWMDGMSESDFKMTEYFYNYNSLINSPSLSRILAEKNIKLRFVLHPKFVKYTSLFKANKNVEILSMSDINLSDCIMSSSLLITDYSSVSWDFYYMKKPVIFFQFDQKDYLETQGTYLRFPEDLFGDCTRTVSDTIIKIENYANHDFREKELFAQRRSEYLKYTDTNNSERIFELIKERYL